ncbi:MAG TPA: Rne/Rng family ribonuclease [Syntrophomonadaceae bacterium]|nr:Rne/Rng family ribonuclease [Syntrophomonadaceae bacterium]
MVREIVAEIYPWESRVGIVEDGRLVEVFWANQAESVGNIYKGRIKDILPGLSCVFVDIGLAKNAFLYAGDILYAGKEKGLNALDLLKSGQDIMVQVKKEAFSEKGARVTGNVTIPGHFLVLLPFYREVSISRKITCDERRKYLRQIINDNKPEHAGIIVRTACLEAEDEEIMAELQQLLRLWQEIRQNYLKSRAPDLVFEDMNVLERALRDYLDGDISRVVINNERLQTKILEFTKNKAYCSRIMVQHEEGDLFEKYSLDKDVRRAIRRKVWLKSGGYLIFDETEAMTVIDVNSGKYTGKTNFEDTVLRLNLEAALEIPKQLRLRSIGGIILIDFIDMKEKGHEEELIDTLKKELEKDKAHTRIIGMTGLGFLEMTRKKSRYGIAEFFTEECSFCNGRGRTLNLYSTACELKRKLLNMGHLEAKEIICEAHPQLLQQVQEDAAHLEYIKGRLGKKIRFHPHEEMSLSDYKLHTGEN